MAGSRRSPLVPSPGRAPWPRSGTAVRAARSMTRIPSSGWATCHGEQHGRGQRDHRSHVPNLPAGFAITGSLAAVVPPRLPAQWRL